MSDIKHNTRDLFELVNPVKVSAGEDAPTLLLEAGIWNTADGNKSGISISTFGELAPLIEPQDARRLAKWLSAAADELSGEKRGKQRNGGKRPRYDDDDDDAY